MNCENHVKIVLELFMQKIYTRRHQPCIQNIELYGLENLLLGQCNYWEIHYILLYMNYRLCTPIIYDISNDNNSNRDN